jgi:hypothetical protein
LRSDIRLPFQHGEQPPLDLRPEDLLFATLMRAVGKSRLLQDGEASEPLGGFAGDHGAAVVAEQGAGQATLEKGLAEAVDEAFCGLVEVPLRVAGQARAVIENGQQDGPHPLPAKGENLVRAVMEVEMPETIDVLGFITAHLPLLPALQGVTLPRAQFGHRLTTVPPQTVRDQVTAQAGVRWKRPQVRLVPQQRGQIVEV